MVQHNCMAWVILTLMKSGAAFSKTFGYLNSDKHIVLIFFGSLHLQMAQDVQILSVNIHTSVWAVQKLDLLCLKQHSVKIEHNSHSDNNNYGRLTCDPLNIYSQVRQSYSTFPLLKQKINVGRTLTLLFFFPFNESSYDGSDLSGDPPVGSQTCFTEQK